jgi:hypothetical protein
MCSLEGCSKVVGGELARSESEEQVVEGKGRSD